MEEQCKMRSGENYDTVFKDKVSRVLYFQWDTRGVINIIIKDGVFLIVTIKNHIVNYQKGIVENSDYTASSVEVNAFSGRGLAMSCDSKRNLIN